MHPDESEALRRWRAGDPAGFARLHALAEPRLKAFCLMLAGDPDAAADLLQETWRKALAEASSYREDRSFKAWLSALAYHLWVDQGRRRRSERRALEIRRQGMSGEAQGTAERDLILREALARLSEEEQAAVLLYDLQGLTLRETAEVLKVSHVAVRGRLARARESLAEALGIPDSP